MSIGAKWDGSHANLTMAKGAISHTGDELAVYVQCNGAPLCSHSNNVGLALTLVDS